jgi:prespore-specific regulator
MPITRQDAWTDDEDLMLAETVLRHIREGGTQLKAFEEVGKKLSRTGAACGFRWNSFVRKQYQSGIELAKKQRKELKKQSKKGEDEPVIEKPVEDAADLNEAGAITMDAVKSYLDNLQEQVEKASLQKVDISKYDKRVKELEEKVFRLSTENEKLKEELKNIEGDHRALVAIMDRARKMVGSNQN